MPSQLQSFIQMLNNISQGNQNLCIKVSSREDRKDNFTTWASDITAYIRGETIVIGKSQKCPTKVESKNVAAELAIEYLKNKGLA